MVKGYSHIKMNLALSQRIIKTDEKKKVSFQIKSTLSFFSVFENFMDINYSTGNKMPSQEHLNFINKLNDTKIPRQSQLIASRLFMKNFPREVKKTFQNNSFESLRLFQTTGAEIENCFQTFGPVHDVKIIAKENTYVY